MAVNYLFDTNVIIYHLNGVLKYNEYFDKQFLSNNMVYISIITRMELLSFSEISNEEEKIIHDLLNQFQILPLLPEIEMQSILIRKKNKIKLPDAIILASAKYTNSVLITEDKQLKDLSLL
jgi:predicted nucleic acid-binding protein